MKPRIKKLAGKYCSFWATPLHKFEITQLDKFTDRLNRKDTGYKDCHGCTIREGDILVTLKTRGQIEVTPHVLSVIDTSYWEIKRQ